MPGRWDFSLSVCMLSFVVYVHVCVCLGERLTVGESFLDIKGEGGSLWLEKSLLALGFPLSVSFVFPCSFPFSVTICPFLLSCWYILQYIIQLNYILLIGLLFVGVHNSVWVNMFQILWVCVSCWRHSCSRHVSWHSAGPCAVDIKNVFAHIPHFFLFSGALFVFLSLSLCMTFSALWGQV